MPRDVFGAGGAVEDDAVHLLQTIGEVERLSVGEPDATLLHELTHWSGAPHRLNRTFGTRFGDNDYAVEELVAELGAAFLCADLGIANEPKLAIYMHSGTHSRCPRSDRS
jgi:antirestriction protein ArdC